MCCGHTISCFSIQFNLAFRFVFFLCQAHRVYLSFQFLLCCVSVYKKKKEGKIGLKFSASPCHSYYVMLMYCTPEYKSIHPSLAPTIIILYPNTTVEKNKVECKNNDDVMQRLFFDDCISSNSLSSAGFTRHTNIIYTRSIYSFHFCTFWN